jgi:hypothetical protein
MSGFVQLSNCAVLLTMANNYMNAKMARMRMYCLADGNVREARYLHHEQFTDHTFLEGSSMSGFISMSEAVESGRYQ